MAPQGDDPNDVLLQDFGLPEVMGPVGRKAWRDYQALRDQARQTRDGEARLQLLGEAGALARRYHFGAERP